LIDDHQISRHTDNLEEDTRISAIYGHIIDVLSINGQDFYIPLVALERTVFGVDSQSHYIPLDETDAQLAATYGTPRDLKGNRVRIEYYGQKWNSGVARIVPGRGRQPSGNITEIPSRGFRYAVAGGGSL
jgi:hypothetical protein